MVRSPAVGPGGVTRWMAVPWQADTASCRSGYQYGDTPVDPYLPTFWAARVPNHVMPEQNYERVLDTSLPLDERREAFFVRAQFFRNIDRPATPETLQQMVDNWYRLGVVTEQPGPRRSRLPADLQGRNRQRIPDVMRVAVVGAGPAGCAAAIALVSRGPAGRPDRRRARRRRRAAPPRGAPAARAARPRALDGAARLRRRARGVALGPSCTSRISSRIRSATAGCSTGRASARRCAAPPSPPERCCARRRG